MTSLLKQRDPVNPPPPSGLAIRYRPSALAALCGVSRDQMRGLLRNAGVGTRGGRWIYLSDLRDACPEVIDSLCERLYQLERRAFRSARD